MKYPKLCWMRSAVLAALAFTLAFLPVQEDDIDLGQRISQALERHPEIESTTVSVSVDEGVATLSGTVSLLLHVTEARDLAAQVPGVVRVDLDLEVQSSMWVDDGELETTLRARFETQPLLANARIEIEAMHGEVTVNGHVSDARARLAARRLASSVPGVQSVIEHLSTPPATDAAIEREIESRVAGEISGDLTSEVDQGHVTLRGRVFLLYDKFRLHEIALGINGVKTVTLDIRVAPPQRDDAF